MRFNLYKTVFFFFVILLTLVHPAQCKNNPANPQFDFANHLFKSGAYQTSIIEFQRFLFLYPDHQKALQAKYQIGLAYQKLKQYGHAIDIYQNILQDHPFNQTMIQAAYELSDCYQYQGKFQMAKNVLKALITRVSDPVIQDEINYRLGWLFIKIQDSELSLQHFDAIHDESKYPLDSIKNAINSKKVPHKKPYVAGILSIVPGLGQAYCGRYRDATLSMIVNGLIGWAAWENFDNQRPAMGTLVSFFGFGFYFGNIYGAVNSAHKHNQRKEKQWVIQLQREID